jgi:hypothetical protein
MLFVHDSHLHHSFMLDEAKPTNLQKGTKPEQTCFMLGALIIPNITSIPLKIK